MTDYREFSHGLSNLSQKGEIKYLTNEPLSKHSSFKIGGNADFFVIPQTEKSLSQVLALADECGVYSYVIGKGTNILFDDSGFRGAVISTLGLDFTDVCGNVINCGAGTSLSAVSRVALEFSLCGMSFAYGIPGSVGGAVFMNAGAYNGSIDGVLKTSTYYDLNDRQFHVLPLGNHSFGYRKSSYADHPERIIVSASFELENGDAAEIKSEMEDFMSRRREKQPLEFPSAGSTFKRYPGRYTAQMIDELSLKGACVGGAEVSTKHAGFIINKGGATCSDVKKLISLVQSKIKEAYGIDIEREVIFVPCEKSEQNEH